MIDKSAIRIRPYKAEDREQVLEALYAGFSMVGDRLFQKTISSKSTIFTILAKSFSFALLVEIALVTLSSIAKSSPESEMSSTSGYFALFQDFKSLQSLLMEPTTVQTMAYQLLRPKFALIGLAVMFLAALSMVYSIFVETQKSTDTYYQSCMEEDLGDIVAYYQKNIPNPSAATDAEKQDQASIKGKKNRSQFWVACLDTHPDIVLGSISLDDIFFHSESLLAKHLREGQSPKTFVEPSEFDGELRRLAVHPNYRRLGISKMLLQTLYDSAKKHGFKRIILSTTLLQKEALVGYIRFGFEREKFVNVSEFFQFWYGQLNLNATAQQKKTQKDNQNMLLKEVGLY
ncbi:hypothetical protein FBU30_007391 [Linnemannia zychae]|nr:hypothetical protein FBU30_007391 [Linnemannia zychae]